MIARLSLAALFVCGAVTGTSAAGVNDSAQSAPPPGLTPIFSNLGTKYPNGAYFCCEGFSWSPTASDEVDPVPFAQYCSNDMGGPACSTTNDAWTSTNDFVPALAFAVYGN